MIRNIALALAAVVAIGGASLATSSDAEAGWKGGKRWHGHHKHWGYTRYHHRPAYYGGCWRKVWVHTYHGRILRTVNVCR